MPWRVGLVGQELSMGLFRGRCVCHLTAGVEIRKFFWPKHEPLPAAAVSNVTQQPTISNTFSPNITFSPQVANPE